MQLTREYFENHPQWSTDINTIDFNGFPIDIWEATLNKECTKQSGLITLHVENAMYEWRFALSGTLNGNGEGYFQGTIFMCTVEELEGFFKICHFDDYQYTL